jgi:hypothetical protein
MQVEVVGADGAVGRAVTASCAALGVSVGAADAPVQILATPASTWPTLLDGRLSVAAAVRRSDAVDTDVTLPVAGWWGGLGTLLTSVALAHTPTPLEVHVAYGLPGAQRAWRRATPTLRSAMVAAATDRGQVRVDGALRDEPVGEGRRLAWFPKPVGPAHAAAVAGLESIAHGGLPTLRTWVAVGSVGSELLQAVGRSTTAAGIGRVVARRAARGGGSGDAADVRWACVVEVRDRDGQIVRAWANGTDPIAATGAMLARAAVATAELGQGGIVPPGRSLLDLGPAETQLDALVDDGILRWSVAQPSPSRH